MQGEVDESEVAGELIRAAGIFGALAIDRLRAEKPKEATQLAKALAGRQVEMKVVLRNVLSAAPSVQLVLGRGPDDDQVLATVAVQRVQTPRHRVN